MSRSKEQFIALLRGINVSGENKIPMAELRSVCEQIGCEGVQTYIQSGNLVCTFDLSAEKLEERLEAAIVQEFGFAIPVIVRTASSWTRYVKSNPFSNESRKEASWVLLCLSKRSPSANAATELQQRATLGEQVAKKGDAIWIYYTNGIGRSKLTPAVLDRYVGSPVTARNWKTVQKLDELAGDAASV